ncbi:hypothetical protein SLA2020_270890 [Shorea laevis]
MWEKSAYGVWKRRSGWDGSGMLYPCNHRQNAEHTMQHIQREEEIPRGVAASSSGGAGNAPAELVRPLYHECQEEGSGTVNNILVKDTSS